MVTYPHRTETDYARFAQEVSGQWSTAEVVVLMQNNLNTHNTSSFYQNLPPEKAYALVKRFEFHFTPKKGSWLNMAELELSAISRQCLARRISDSETLSREMKMVVKERNEMDVKVKRQFTIENAGEKLNRHYENVIAKT